MKETLTEVFSVCENTEFVKCIKMYKTMCCNHPQNIHAHTQILYTLTAQGYIPSQVSSTALATVALMMLVAQNILFEIITAFGE